MTDSPQSLYGFTIKLFSDIGAENSAYWRERFQPGFGASQVELPNKMTVLTGEDAAKALSAGYKRVEGRTPSVKVLALLLGQWAIETGNGKYVHNYNFGNVKRYSSTPYYQYFRCSEIINGVEQFFDPPSPQCAFAAYKTPEEGAEAYIRILKKRPHWWAGLQSGNVNTFNTALSTAPKYYTASPSLYLKGLTDRVNAYLPQAQKYGALWWKTTLSAIFGLGLAGGAAVLLDRKINGNFPRY